MSDRQVNLAALRAKAEAAIAQAKSSTKEENTDSDLSLEKLLEELRIYQTELEIQNQELIAVQVELSGALTKYRMLFSQLPLPALLVDRQGFVVEANGQAQILLGLRQNASLQRRSVLQLFTTDSKSDIYQVLRAKGNVSFEVIGPLGLKLASGEVVPHSVSFIQTTDERSGEQLLLMVLIDRSNEVALRESEQTFHSFADSSMSLIWAAGLDKLCFYFNQGWLDFTGRSYEQEAGNGWAEGVHPEDFERCLRIFTENFDKRQSFSMDYRLRRHDGEYRWIRGNGAPRYDSKGAFVGYIGHCLDIHDRVEAENKLRNLSAVVEQSPESIVITDKDAVIQYVNPACEASSGYTREELIGQNPRIFNSGLTPLHVYERVWEALLAGRPWSGQFSNRKKSGEVFYEYVRIAPIRDEAGVITNYVSVKENVTEKVHTENDLERYRHHLEDLVTERTLELEHAKEEAEAGNLAKSSFLANISHEIRTPLNAITGMTHFLRRSELTAQQVDKLDMIENAGNHLIRIINDVLDLSKIEAGKFVLEDAPVHIEDLLGNVTSMLGQKAQDKGLRFNTETTSLLRNLHGDHTRLQQALLNYASNAIKFTETGHITLRVKEEAQTDETATLRFEVEDSGIGIASETLPKLFAAFEQVDNSTTRKYGGTGLGLPITKKIAELMGGTAGVTSTPGQGSTFWFTAVLRKGRQSAKEEARPGGETAEQVILQHHGGKRILLVEDEPINREIAQMVLEDVGLQIDLAENGREAVEKARLANYAAILMDMQMPVLDGLDATREIRQLPGCEKTPILAVTANAFAENKNQCFDAGMNDFISKPVMPKVLYETLLKWFEKGQG